MGKGGGNHEQGHGYQIIQPPNPQLPNQDLLNAIAAARAGAGSQYSLSGNRAIDYFSGVQVPQLQMPQFGQGAQMGGWGQVGQQQPMMGFGGMPPQQLFSSVFHGPGGIMDMGQNLFQNGGQS